MVITRLGCDACDTELSGRFEVSEFAALNSDEWATLKVFLASRGNMKEVERHLGVSYPTARSRFDALLAKLGLEQTRDPRLDVLESLAQGKVNVDEALGKL